MRFLQALVRILLLPFSLLYGIGVELRNLLFALHVLPVYRSSLRVISVGNLVAGGTGKTPFTIWLANQLLSEYSLAIVSRGYKRQSKGLQVVAHQGRLLLSAAESGDEPSLLARKVPRATVIVAEKRKEALQWLENQNAAQVVILDDGFQHRYVHRDVDLLLFKTKTQFLANFMLPSGTWREFPWHARRAHFVGLPQKQYLPFVQRQRQFHVSVSSQHLIDCRFQKVRPVSDLAGRPVVAFAAIARPQPFFQTLKAHGLQVVQTFSFKDHHHYSLKDVEAMVNFCRERELNYLICTEKDLVKICELIEAEPNNFLQGINILALDYQLQVQEQAALLREIKKLLTKN